MKRPLQPCLLLEQLHFFPDAYYLGTSPRWQHRSSFELVGRWGGSGRTKLAGGDAVTDLRKIRPRRNGFGECNFKFHTRLNTPKDACCVSLFDKSSDDVRTVVRQALVKYEVGGVGVGVLIAQVYRLNVVPLLFH